MIAYKFLGAGGVGPFSGHRWPPPSARDAGDWVEASGPIGPCAGGVHACRAGQLAWWLHDELWRIELGGARVEDEYGVVAERGRLLERVPGWDAGLREQLAGALARRARDRVAPTLREAGLEAAAAALAASEGLAEIEAACRHAEADCERAGDGFTALAAGYGGDVAWAAGLGHLRILVDSADRLDAHLAGPPGRTSAGRSFSSSWLARQLGLE